MITDFTFLQVFRNNYRTAGKEIASIRAARSRSYCGIVSDDDEILAD
jgi:hypothetical protein